MLKHLKFFIYNNIANQCSSELSSALKKSQGITGFLKSLFETRNGDGCDYGEQPMKYHNVTFKKTPGGTWYTRIRKNGQQFYLSATTQNKLRLKINEFLKGSDFEGSLLSYKNKRYTVDQFFEYWLDVYKKEIKESSKRAYRVAFNRFSDRFSKFYIQDVRAYDIVTELKPFKGMRSAQQMFVLMKDLFGKAVREGIINQNPLANLDMPKHEQAEKHIFTSEQRKKFIQVCTGGDKYCDFFMVALLQGLRRGEILMLKPNDIDFEKNTLRVDESLSGSDGDFTTKNKYSNRTMPLFESTKAILQKYRNLPDTERIFRLGTHELSVRLKEILESASLPILSTHELRHTFISFCRDNGVPEHVVQKWVGHQIGSKVTSQVYTHVLDETSKRFSDLLNNIQ